MNEIEVRARVPSSIAVISDLQRHGFVETAAYLQEDILVDYPDARIFRSGRKLRIRTEGSTTEMTFKGAFVGDATASRRRETSVRLSVMQVEPILFILAELGLDLVVRVKKERRVLANGAIVAAIDDWPIIGTVVEFEGAEADVKAIASTVFPDTLFRNYRLVELVAEAEATRHSTWADLARQHYEETGDDLTGLLKLL